MGTTNDPNDPGLHQQRPGSGMNESYLVLSEEERARGFVRPVHRTYVHTVCGAATSMGQSIAETYARDPSFYGATYCVGCKTHLPVGIGGEFVWDVPAPPFRTDAEYKAWLATCEKVGT